MDIKLSTRFFNPLVSIHKKYYIDLLLLIEKTIEDARVIAIRRDVLLNQLHRNLEKSTIYEDISDETDYDVEKSSPNKLMDDMTYILRMFIRSGWIDLDESGDYSSDLVFITHAGKELTRFLRRLMSADDQSGYVIGTFSNLTQVRSMPDNGFVCIRNAYESTRGLLTSLEMMYSKIKEYYVEQLEHTHPEEILKAHFDGYIYEVIDKVLFPLKVDDSIDRFRGPILDEINEIISDTSCLNHIILAAKQTKRIANNEDGYAQVLTMLNFMKQQYNDIEEIVAQLDEKNITDDSFYKPRKQREMTMMEPFEIEEIDNANQEEVNNIVDTYGAKFTKSKVNSYASMCLNMDYDLRWLYRLHGKALEEVQKMINEKKIL